MREEKKENAFDNVWGVCAWKGKKGKKKKLGTVVCDYMSGILMGIFFLLDLDLGFGI